MIRRIIMEYPKTFDVCPNCGSMVRIIESESREQSVGKDATVRAGAKTGVLITQTAIFDPTRPGILAPKKVPIIMARFDICGDCGTLYCVEVQRAEGTASPHIRRDNFQQRL